MASIPFVQFDGGDLKLAACTEFATAPMEIPDVITSELQPAAAALKANIARILQMMMLPAHIGDIATMMQNFADIAEFETTGSVTAIDPDYGGGAHEDRWLELFKLDVAKRSADFDARPDLRAAVLASVKHGVAPAEMMGTILRERFAFSRLSGIREAYGCAFDKDSAEIDSILTDRSIDALQATRNVIVHKAGIADRDYIRRMTDLKLPPLGLINNIILDG